MSKTFRIKLKDTDSAVDSVFVVRAENPKVSNILKYNIKRPKKVTPDTYQYIVNITGLDKDRDIVIQVNKYNGILIGATNITGESMQLTADNISEKLTSLTAMSSKSHRSITGEVTFKGMTGTCNLEFRPNEGSYRFSLVVHTIGYNPTGYAFDAVFHNGDPKEGCEYLCSAYTGQFLTANAQEGTETISVNVSYKWKYVTVFLVSPSSSGTNDSTPQQLECSWNTNSGSAYYSTSD